jgi:hypothetical protein
MSLVRSKGVGPSPMDSARTAVDGCSGQVGDATAHAESHDADTVAPYVIAGLQVVLCGTNVGEDLVVAVAAEALERELGLFEQANDARPFAMEERRHDADDPVGGESVGHRLQVPVHTPNLLGDDHGWVGAFTGR